MLLCLIVVSTRCDSGDAPDDGGGCGSLSVGNGTLPPNSRNSNSLKAAVSGGFRAREEMGVVGSTSQDAKTPSSKKKKQEKKTGLRLSNSGDVFVSGERSCLFRRFELRQARAWMDVERRETSDQHEEFPIERHAVTLSQNRTLSHTFGVLAGNNGFTPDSE